MKETVVFVNPI